MSSSSRDRLVSHPHQSLFQHLSSVDEVSRLALEAKSLSTDFFESDIDELRRLLVYFHDFGKAADFFQYKITEVARRENPELKELDGEHVRYFQYHPDKYELEEANTDERLRGHSLIGAFVVQTALEPQYDQLLRAQLYEVIARHHGNLKNFSDAVCRGSEDDNNRETLDGQWTRVSHHDYRAILEHTGFTYATDLKAVKQAGLKLLFSVVYRELTRNTSLKPYLQTVFLFSLLLAGDKGDMMLGNRSVVGRVQLLPGDLIERFKLDRFGAVSSNQLDKWREEAYQRVITSIRRHTQSGFYSITLPTGMGKTLTAYNAAIQLQGLMTGGNGACAARIIYCLPFTSVIDQNAAILEQILTLGEDLSGELAKHHYLADWPARRGDDVQELEYSDKEYLVEGWEYTLTVTTFVQLLETIVSNRNRKLRKFHNLANAIVILDEVQSIPPKYFNLVSEMFQALQRWLGTRFVFVTATQPFLMPREVSVVELTDPTRAYTQTTFERMNRIDLDLSLWLEGPADLKEQMGVFDRAIREEDTRSFLIILNLVRESREVFTYLSQQALPGVEYIYLSSAVLPVERKRRIALIKQRTPGVRKVVVSTQVVEAGVDIDLDVVYRAFAPLDSINQSAGRCNRNMTEGERGSVRLFRSEKATVIYDETLLVKTEWVLRDRLKLMGGQLLPESCFYALNEAYATEIRQSVAENAEASATILKHLYRLEFEDAEREFKLIEQAYARYGVFIDDPERLPTVMHDGRVMNSTEVYRAMRSILDDEQLGRWDKKQQLRLLRPALLQYVVQFPEKYLPEELREEASERPFIRLTTEVGKYDYTRCYDLGTGYYLPEETPTRCF